MFTSSAGSWSLNSSILVSVSWTIPSAMLTASTRSWETSHEKRSGEWTRKDSISRLVNYPLPSASCPPQHISPHSWSCSQCHLYSDLLMTGSQLCKNRKVFRPNKQHWGEKMSFSKRRLTLLFSTCSFVLCRDVHNPISIDVKCDLDLRDTTRGRGDSDKSELTQHFVVCCHFSLSLTNFNLHLSLSISCCGEHLQYTKNTIYRPSTDWLCSNSASDPSTWLFFVGIVVFLLMSLVKTPPRVSIPKESGVTSNSSTSVTSPAKTPPWMAAPIATASSGLTDLLGVRPKRSWTVCWTCKSKQSYRGTKRVYISKSRCRLGNNHLWCETSPVCLLGTDCHSGSPDKKGR